MLGTQAIFSDQCHLKRPEMRPDKFLSDLISSEINRRIREESEIVEDAEEV